MDSQDKYRIEKERTSHDKYRTEIEWTLMTNIELK